MSARRRSAIAAAASAKLSQRPVRTSTSEAISSPTRCSSSSVPLRGGLELLEAVDEPVRLGVEDGELLLDRDGEVRAVLEGLAGRSDLLVRRKPLGLTHRAKVAEPPRAPSSSAGRRRAGRCAEGDALVGGQREEGVELRREVVRVAGLEAHEVAVLGRVLGLDPGGDLGEAGVAGDERRRAARGRLGGDHPEGLREDRRRHARRPRAPRGG